MALISFEIDDNSVDVFGKSIEDASKASIKRGLSETKRAWQAELVRQQRRLRSSWTPLKKIPKGKSYFDRKQYEYYSGKSKNGKVRFLSILKRTGRMMQGYVNGIRIDNVNLKVEIPFPLGAEVRAKVHQGLLPLPTGVLAHRPFELEKFEDLAIDIMSDAITKDL